MKQKTSIYHDILILAVITLCAGLLLGLVHGVTEGPIKRRQAETRANTERVVFEDAVSFEPVESLDKDAIKADLEAAGLTKTSVNGVDEAFDADGNLLGWVFDVTNQEGYGGEVELMVGMRNENGALSMNGISFLALTETAGMGMKAEDATFKDQFTGLSADQTIVYTTSGKSADNEIDAVSGATVTTNAVTKAVNAAITVAESLKGGSLK